LGKEKRRNKIEKKSEKGNGENLNSADENGRMEYQKRDTFFDFLKKVPGE
jgi:hypothetical protein